MPVGTRSTLEIRKRTECSSTPVVTTGIYCRPVCPSRRPKRENAKFFDRAQDAEQAGFRACKKCDPSSTVVSPPPESVLKACRILDEASVPPTLSELAGAVGLSPHYFHRLFKKTVGITPKAYASSRRSERFRNNLTSERSVTTAMYRAGYQASSRCCEAVGDELGMNPTAFRDGGPDQLIRSTITECRLGWVAIAATSRGLCMIELGDDPTTLRTAVYERFPKVVIDSNDVAFLALVAQVVDLIAAPDRSIALPLDIQGTAFQRLVWEALRNIPLGETATYCEIAEAIGRPSAARAVARACATNPVAVAIPCQRVVQKNGELSGYRWGIERKQELLCQESRSCEEQLMPTTLAAKSALGS